MATAGAIPLPTLDWDNPDQVSSFKEWNDFLESYFQINEVPDDKKWHYILLSAGHRGHELSNSWSLTELQKKDPKIVFKKFEEHMIGTINKWVMRLELSSLMQKDDEAIDDFGCRLKAKATACQFRDDDSRDEQITFQLIKGVLWPEERKALIKKGNSLTLEQAVKSAQSFQATMNNTSSFSHSTMIHAVNRSSGRQCKYCGLDHPPRQCPAYGKICNNCGLRNHFSKMCLQKKSQQASTKPATYDKSRRPSPRRERSNRRVHEMTLKAGDDTLDCGAVTITVSDVSVSTRQSIMAKLNARPPDVNRKCTLTVKADTGANGNLLPLRCLRQMYPDGNKASSMLTPCDVSLNAVNGTPINQYGYINIPVSFEQSDWSIETFYVCDTDGPPILSCGTTEELGIISITKSKDISVVSCNGKQIEESVPRTRSSLDEDRGPNAIGIAELIKDRNDLKRLYPECFEGIGHFKQPFKIELKDDAIPVVSPPRKYPIQLKDEIVKRIHEIEEQGVIEKCTDESPSEWVNSLAFARKASGELRICLDPRNLNRSIKRTFHKIPTLEEITHEFTGSTVFSKLDAKHGYWSVELDNESSHLCTFNSPAGKYRFRRLPFGLCVSQDIFQKHMDNIIHKAGKGILGIADDVVVHGATEDEHNQALHRLMKVAKEYGLVFRLEKCEILRESIEFYGLVWSKSGMMPDTKKLDNIRSRRAPESRAELQSFLGLIQYLSPFIPHLSAKTSNMRQLLKSDVEWCWTAEHQKDFEACKDAVHEDMKLRYFDPNLPVELEVDASMQGLGAALVQEGKPIAFASKALTPAESRYANIERELLAVVYGLEKFHTYVYGKPLTVYSDHKPLENIVLKQLSQSPPRLQRMLLRVQAYNFELKYKPGKHMVYADYLSRVSPSPGPTVVLEHAIHMVQISVGQLEKLRLASKQDNQISVLSEQIVSGWPAQAQQLPKIIRPYWSMRDYLTVEDGLVYAGQRLVIPEKFRQEFLERIHAGHLGITKSQLRAKESVYWPNMMADIEKAVSDCDICLRNAKSQQREPMQSHPIPSQPWEVVSSDLFELDGHMYILMADHYSKMPFARHLKSTSCAEVVKFCKDMFAIHGVPKRLYTDNGPQYSAAEFRNFAIAWDFEHVTSSPHYPQSNGFIERMVGVVKPILKKARQSGNDPQMALLCYRSTPIDSRTPSPAELLYGRKIRSNLPAKNEVRLTHHSEHDNLVDRSQNAEYDYNERCRGELSELVPGVKVVVQKPDKTSWVPGTVVEKCEEPRSYKVAMPNGNVVRRNRRVLKELSPEASQKFCFRETELEHVLDGEEDKNVVDNSTKGCPALVTDVPSKEPVEQLRRSKRVVKKPERLIESD